jgi:DNA repair protein RadA/Sms
VQALVAPTNAPMPRRNAQGLEGSRLALLLAVLERRTHIESLAGFDVWASVAGGVRVSEAAADLAAAIAVASARLEIAVPADMVAIGEVGLGGEVRQVGQLSRRVAEAARLGFETAIVPTSAPAIQGIRMVRVPDLATALEAAGLGAQAVAKA